MNTINVNYSTWRRRTRGEDLTLVPMLQEKYRNPWVGHTWLPELTVFSPTFAVLLRQNRGQTRYLFKIQICHLTCQRQKIVKEDTSLSQTKTSIAVLPANVLKMQPASVNKWSAVSTSLLSLNHHKMLPTVSVLGSVYVGCMFAAMNQPPMLLFSENTGLQRLWKQSELWPGQLCMWVKWMVLDTCWRKLMKTNYFFVHVGVHPRMWATLRLEWMWQS